MIEPHKIKFFLSNGNTYGEPHPIDRQFLNGFEESTLVSFNAAVRKFMVFWNQTTDKPFHPPPTAEELCEFCFWARNSNQSRDIRENGREVLIRNPGLARISHHAIPKGGQGEAIHTAPSGSKGRHPAPAEGEKISNTPTPASIYFERASIGEQEG
jgi:hypothetical protein